MQPLSLIQLITDLKRFCVELKDNIYLYLFVNVILNVWVLSETLSVINNFERVTAWVTQLFALCSSQSL